MKKRNVIVIGFLIMVLLGLGAAVWLIKEDEKSELLEKLYDYQGYTRVVTQEEFGFYSYFVERDLPNDINKDDMKEKNIEYTNRVNAVFFLGNKLGLCEPYSFELLQLRMEQENQNRRLKLENGEIIYGLEQFTLETFFQYTLDNLETDIHRYLEENIDEGILNLAENYYKANKERFKYRETISYDLIVDEKIENVSVDSEGLNALGKSDMSLADFLYVAEVGDAFEDIQGEKARKIIIKDIVYGKEGFKNNQESVLYQFVRNDLYEMIIAQIEKNNPVEIDLN